MSKSKTAIQKTKNESNFPKAKIFKNGRSQAIRLPKEFRFEGQEIGIGRVGNAVILFPLSDPWAVFFEGAEELSKAELTPFDREQNQQLRKFEK
jgi:antitoxin VapB